MSDASEAEDSVVPAVAWRVDRVCDHFEAAWKAGKWISLHFPPAPDSIERARDWAKRGAQSFPVLIPQELTPGSITVESTGSASADGKSYEGLKVTTVDLEIRLLLDNNHRLMRLEVPAAKVSVIRE